MRPTDLLLLLSSMIVNRLNLLITGAPGIGKSDLVNQAARAADADLILSHPVVEDPTSAAGLPWIVDGHARFLPFGMLERAMNATKPTVWFLDDLGQAPAATQASYMQLLLAREVNGHKLSDYVTFVAATNRRTDRAGVSGILEPVKSRFCSIAQSVPAGTSLRVHTIGRSDELTQPAYVGTC
jgi:MoxR-like ATPase